MTENNSNQETNKYLFINLVTMLGITAMQQLGKIINPAVGKAAINLEAAQATIDTLDMLFTKTEGKLDKDETRLLEDTRATLKMNYVETEAEMKNVECRMKNEKQQDTATKEPQVAAANPEPPAEGKSEPKPGSEQSKDPKFHKSYD